MLEEARCPECGGMVDWESRLWAAATLYEPAEYIYMARCKSAACGWSGSEDDVDYEGDAKPAPPLEASERSDDK